MSTLEQDPEIDGPIIDRTSPVTYSICITVYNECKRVKESLDSILKQIGQDFEIVVVDSLSTDGTSSILAAIAGSNPQVKVVESKCSRGKGRQIALERSSGRYIIANMDMDDTFEPSLRSLLKLYHRRCEGDLVWVRTAKSNQVIATINQEALRQWGGGIMIGPRKLLVDLGGWKDLQVYEDLELAARAARHNRYRWSFYDIIRIRGPRNEHYNRFQNIANRSANLLIRRRRSEANINTTKRRLQTLLVYVFVFPYLRVRKPYRLFDARQSRYFVSLQTDRETANRV